MDMMRLLRSFSDVMKKYRYAILVLVIGLALMLLPSGNQVSKEETPSIKTPDQTTDPSKELSDILSQIQGVGKVQVLLTVKAGETTRYQTDDNISTSENGSTVHKDTVIITDSSRNEEPLVVQVLPPEYLGAVIVCQGAENAAVRLAVVEAVCKATGLGADKITVLKMK